MKSVAILTPWFPNEPGDSAGAFVADSALSVERAGWRVGVLAVRPWVPPYFQCFANNMVRGDIQAAAFRLSALQTARIPVLPRSMLRQFMDFFSDRIVARELENVARSISADVIHVQTEGFTPVAAHVANTLRLPFVVTLHGINTHPSYLHSPYQKRRLRIGLAAADRIILVGEPLRDFFQSYVGSEAAFEVVPNGIEIPSSHLVKWTSDNGPRRIVSVSNLQEGKGIDLTLLALARLRREGISNWIYQIIGDGPEKATLLKQTMDFGLVDKVTFVGPVRHAEIFNHLSRNEIFVLPSYREAFGIAYLEAMAAGLLTIGVKGQGPSGFIRSGENGVLVSPRDVDALVEAMRDILTGDEKYWREIALEGQRTAQRNFTWEAHARKLIALYERVIDGK